MRQSQLFTRTLKDAPKDEVSLNAQLLIRAGFIYKNSAGIYTQLPLGWRVIQKIARIIREEMNAISIIPARNEGVPIWRTSGRYRKLMKRGYSKKKYHQRSKNETVNYVVKQLMGDMVYALDWRMQNKELLFRYIMYAVYRFDKIKNIFCFIVLLLEDMKLMIKMLKKL